MTCIVGLVEKGKVYLGGDSCGTSRTNYTIRKNSKVFKNGQMLIGYAGSFRMGQILQYNFKPPKQSKGTDDLKFLCTTFVDALVKSFTSHGYIKNPGTRPEGGVFIIGYKGNIYKIWQDFQVEQIYGNFMATGCGESYALGALRVLVELKLSPEKKIEKALQITESFDSAVKGPFNIVVL